MRWQDSIHQTCSIARATSIFGDKWTLLILRLLFINVNKFSDIQQALGITKHRLTDRLARLLDEGIVFKQLYDEKYNRHQYLLTEKGTDLYAVMITIGQWGDKWLADECGSPVEYIHTKCGHNAKPVLSCSHCGDKLTPDNISLKIGPGLKHKLDKDEISDADKKIYANVFGLNK